SKKRVGGMTPEATYHFITTHSQLVTVDELVEAFGEDLLLPTQMPDGLELRKIYLWGNETIQAILSFSDREISDYREGKVTIQLKKPATTGLIPDDPNIVKVGDKLVSAMDSPTKPDSVLFFYHKSTYYLFTTTEYRKDTLFKIVENMRTMKSKDMG
ncbi:MAG: hypothetical protein ACE5Z5_07985, partial [Candidatus Bathyarchaeia archaeon]